MRVNIGDIRLFVDTEGVEHQFFKSDPLAERDVLLFFVTAGHIAFS